jgi:hypothetical protein
LFAKEGSPMTMVGFPLLLIPLAIYNIIVFLMPGVSLSEPVVKLTLMSGAEWPLTLSDMLLALGIVLLLFEVIKGARPGAKYLMDHLLSLIVFGGAVAEFLLWPRFGTSTYFLLALLALVDFLSGIALRTRRRTQAVAAAAVAPPARRGPAAPEPTFDPAPEPARPAPVAEAAPLQHVEPKILEPKILEPKILHPDASGEPSPQVASPELQPGNGLPPASEPPLR